MATLEERVQRIEAENRRLRWCVVGLASFAAVVGLAGMRHRTAEPDEIRARSFVAVDEKGRESVRISGGDLAKRGGEIRMTGKGLSLEPFREYDDLSLSLWPGGIHAGCNDDAVLVSASKMWFSRQRGMEIPLELSPEFISLVEPMPEDWTPEPQPPGSRLRPPATRADAWRARGAGVHLAARTEPPGGRVWIRNARGNVVAMMGTDEEGRGEFAVLGEPAEAREAEPPPPHP